MKKALTTLALLGSLALPMKAQTQTEKPSLSPNFFPNTTLTQEELNEETLTIDNKFYHKFVDDDGKDIPSSWQPQFNNIYDAWKFRPEEETRPERIHVAKGEYNLYEENNQQITIGRTRLNDKYPQELLGLNSVTPTNVVMGGIENPKEGASIRGQIQIDENSKIERLIFEDVGSIRLVGKNAELNDCYVWFYGKNKEGLTSVALYSLDGMKLNRNTIRDDSVGVAVLNTSVEAELYDNIFYGQDNGIYVIDTKKLIAQGNVFTNNTFNIKYFNTQTLNADSPTTPAIFTENYWYDSNGNFLNSIDEIKATIDYNGTQTQLRSEEPFPELKLIPFQTFPHYLFPEQTSAVHSWRSYR